MVFCEHRYYGKIFETVNETFSRKNIGYLSIEQALADYAVLLPQPQKYNANDKTMVSFGGRRRHAVGSIKYPDVVDGAWQSAPQRLQLGLKATSIFRCCYRRCRQCCQRCLTLIRESFSLILSLANAGTKGLREISQKSAFVPLTADRVTH